MWVGLRLCPEPGRTFSAQGYVRHVSAVVLPFTLSTILGHGGNHICPVGRCSGRGGRELTRDTYKRGKKKQARHKSSPQDPRTFQFTRVIHVEDTILSDLQSRLRRARWNDAVADDWSYGTEKEALGTLVDHWLAQYWRARTALNPFFAIPSDDRWAGPLSSTSEDCGHYGNAVPNSNGGPPLQVSRQLPS